MVHTCDCKRLSRPHTHCWKRSCKLTWCSCILLLTRQTLLLYLLGQSSGTHNPKLIPQRSQKHIYTTMLEQLMLESDQKNCHVRFWNQDGMLGVIGQVRELKPTANSHNTFTIKERLELVQWAGLLDRPTILQRCTLFGKIPTLYLLYQDHLCILQLHKGQLTFHTLRNRTTGISHKPPHPGNNMYGIAQGPPTTHRDDCWILSTKPTDTKGLSATSWLTEDRTEPLATSTGSHGSVPGWTRNSGPFIQSSEDISSSAPNPRETRSAGLSSPQQWNHWLGSVRSWISRTLLATNCFHLEGLPLIQQSATMESVQHLMETSGRFNVLCTKDTNLAQSKDPKCSKRGIVIALTWATRALDMTNDDVYVPSGIWALRYTQAPYPVEEASPKPSSCNCWRSRQATGK